MRHGDRKSAPSSHGHNMSGMFAVDTIASSKRETVGGAFGISRRGVSDYYLAVPIRRSDPERPSDIQGSGPPETRETSKRPVLS